MICLIWNRFLVSYAYTACIIVALIEIVAKMTFDIIGGGHRRPPRRHDAMIARPLHDGHHAAMIIDDDENSNKQRHIQ